MFVRHFPPATTEFDLRATFGAFGAIAADGVTLRASKTQKSETAVEKHAFVAFEDESGFTNTMTAVREGREVLVLGAPVGVEAKREKPPARRAARRREAPRRGSIPGEASGVRVSGGPRARARPGGARGRGREARGWAGEGQGASRQEVEKVQFVEKRTESDEFRTESPAARRERFVSNRNHRPRRRMHDSLTDRRHSRDPELSAFSPLVDALTGVGGAALRHSA